MKIIEELFDVYRNHLSGNDEDFKMLTEAFLEEMDRESLEEFIHELSDQEFNQLVGLYVMHFLKMKYKKETKPFSIKSMNKNQLH